MRDCAGGRHLSVAASHLRIDGPAKVTGRAAFAADIPVANLAHATVVTSTVARGSITGFDLERAKKTAGVLAIFTHRELAGLIRPVKHLMAGGYANSSALPMGSAEVRHAGQLVALVVAETLEAALEAASLVKVDYQVERAYASMQDPGGAPKPLAEVRESFHDVAKGDAEGAWKSAAVRFDSIYETPVQHHNPIEQFGTTCVWRGEKLTVYEPTRFLLAVQHGLAAQLELDPKNVEVICPYIGGHFGSKLALSQYTAPVAYAARALGRPIKYVASRRQCFTVQNHRPDTRHRIRIGAANNGRFTALMHDAEFTSSRFDNFGLEGTDVTGGMYGWPALRGSECLVQVDRNTPGPMRAPPEVPYLFAVESAVDEIAAQLKIDPIELRRRNDTPTDPVSGKPFNPRAMMKCFDLGATHFGWERRRAEPRSMREGDWLAGYGCAAAVRPAKRSPAALRMRLSSDGTVEIETAHHEIGNGIYTALALEASERLQIPVEKIAVRLGDTRFPPAGISGGSSTTASLVPLVAEACERIRERAGDRLGKTGGERIEVEAVSDAEGKPSGLDKVREGHVALSSPGEKVRWAFGAQFAEVRIHAVTGQIKAPRLLGAFAAGHIVNRLTTISQLQGGMLWGMSAALFESSEIDGRTGRYTNDNLADYLVPTAADATKVEALLAEEAGDPENLIGVGEIGIIGMNAAVANAVFHATGHRFRRLPIRVEHVIEAGVLG